MMPPFVDPGQVQMFATLELLRGRYENAIGTITPLAAIPDAPVNVNLIAGEAWAAAGDLDQAADEFRKTLQAEMTPPRAHVFLGEIQAKQGDLEASQQSFRDARAAFDKLVTANGKDPSPRTNRGAFFMRTAKMDEAREDFAVATKLDPRFFWALGNLSMTYSASADPAQRDGKKALALADQACEISLQRNGWCLSVRAVALAELERFDEAVETQRKAVELCSSREVHKYRERLRLYQRGKPFRFSPEGDQEPWLALDRVVVPHEEAPVGSFDCFPGGDPPIPKSKTEIAKNQDAVVLIKSESGFGTGMILDSRGYVLTCAHVLPYAGPVTVHFGAAGSPPPGNLTEQAEVIAADYRNDLALLRFNPPIAIRDAAPEFARQAKVRECLIEHTVLGDLVLEDALRESNARFVEPAIQSFRRTAWSTTTIGDVCADVQLSRKTCSGDSQPGDWHSGHRRVLRRRFATRWGSG
ncbi:trypsin-like peptidase domain-containing protein [Stieleria sp. ICT_E10.1]|uniref:serine protease n=1 Tax=Stieleria sedimenti TaxID=2976331 RepID=UPI0021808B7F|nr:serine protease [Stieleria sedimenti]MCS7471319.1 trypsin-like peptidase domain-containing protein [Stieleria sedimenti]